MNTKTAFFIMIFLALIVVPVHAQSDEPPIPEPPPNGTYVLDELDWLTSEQESELNGTINRLDNDGLAEIAVVSLDNCGTDKHSFRKLLFDTWGIGHTDDNDGLLILVCWYGGDASRRSVEQLYGAGLNGILSSQKTDQIAQDNFAHSFQQGHPGEGLLEMVSAYDQLFRGNLIKPRQINQRPDYWLIGFLIFALGLFLFAIKRIQNSPDEKSPGRKGSNKRTGTKKNGQKKEEPGWWFGGDGGGGGFDGGSSDGGGGSSSNF
jgi:uncharacterized protein